MLGFPPPVPHQVIYPGMVIKSTLCPPLPLPSVMGREDPMKNKNVTFVFYEDFSKSESHVVETVE